MSQPFSLLVKPASADCNLRCSYCFYLDHSAFYPDERIHRMSEETLERMVKSYMQTDQPQYAFGWQGGEPTLMGVDFFRKAVEFQRRYGHPGAVVGNGLQTNGVLIDDELARLLAEYHFLVGVSVDGPPEIHNVFRLKANGQGSYDDVMRGIGHLCEQRVDFNILTLVSDSNVRHPQRVYEFLCDQDFLFHQYIPCVEVDERLALLPFAIQPEAWGEFLCGIFDAWYPEDTRRVSVRLFDSILALSVDGVRNICHYGRNCCQYFVVEHNGDIFPCDFFVEKRLLLGNIGSSSWTQLQDSPPYRDFGALKQQWHPTCDACEFVNICSGDCLKHRLCNNGGDPRRLSHLCKGWKIFYQHTRSRFEELAATICRERLEAERQTRARAGMRGAKPGRNDLCPCGSGQKFKKCCGRTG